ncbi:hypothetical protein GMOD_00007932 [Pyrenophora seminiperda CCB06]|uniref:Uncharacterized protein n=1 Tax=Pyrenophora seminiperda CCB06 TaxID=1302712 RepID=A0A3M7MGE0_9PLEO|nr:hypothetical protein GMOD_00007932 [Pyrenophora seminiperda CCB06]
MACQQLPPNSWRSSANDHIGQQAAAPAAQPPESSFTLLL